MKQLSQMKSVGIIGGLGPETTAEFYLEIIFQCQKENNEQRPSIVMSSVPLPLEIERDLIHSNKGIKRYIPFLVREAKRLEAAGVDFLVMPCNSLHVFIEEVRSAVKIPVMSIIEETARYIAGAEYKTIGLISTSATVANKVYESQFQQMGINYITPDTPQSAHINLIIQRLIDGRHLKSDRLYIESIAGILAEHGAECVALACTDLQLLLPIKSDVPVFDTMKILAESTARRMLY